MEKGFFLVLLFLLFIYIVKADSIIASFSYPDVLIPGYSENFIADVKYESGKTNYTDEGLQMVLKIYDLDNSVLCTSTQDSDASGRIKTSCSIFTTAASAKFNMNVSDNSGLQDVFNKTVTVGHSKCEVIPFYKNMDLGSTGTEALKFKITNPKNERVSYNLNIIETGELPIKFSLTEEKNITVIVPPDSFYISYMDIFPVFLGKHDYSLECFSNLSRADNYTQDFSIVVRTLTTRAGFTYVLVPGLDFVGIIFVFLIACLITFLSKISI